MKFFSHFTILFIVIIFFPRMSIACDVEVDISACRSMLHIFETMKGNASKEEISLMLDSVLRMKAYQVMFRHYNRSWRPDHLPVPVFKRMIMSLKFKDTYSNGENQRADQMFPYWLKFYNDLDLFSNNIYELENKDIKSMITNAVNYAQSWLPPEWHIPNFYVTIHPNGGSTAFAIDTAQGYDFFQLPRDSSGNISWHELLVTVSHESHHLGIKTPGVWSVRSSDSIAYQFLSLFIAEGTAIKFINNYPGGCVPVIDELKLDTSFSKSEQAKWWQKYTSEESELFTRFVETFNNAYSGKLSAIELQSEIGQFWLNGYIPPVYFIGAELFGAIWYGHGKEGTFKAMRDPKQILILYNEAVRRKPKMLGQCYVIPDSTVQHSLLIGSAR